MSKLTVSNINSRYASVAALNNNFNAVVDAIENTLSRDGTSPNQMEANIDMNSYRIVNLPDPSTDGEPATKGWIEGLPDTAAASAAAAEASATAAAASEVAAEAAAANVVDWDFVGQWTTATAYAVNNIVSVPSGAYQGWSFICIVAHTSGGTFATDYSGGKWEIIAQRGAAGAGTGDMLAANNLSDVASVSSARTNLGLTTLATTTPGTGVATALAVNVGSAGAPVLFNGAGGTPSSLTLTNGTSLPLTTGVTGTLPVANGGTGQTTYTNGQLLIGNTSGNTLTKATLTAGTGIAITNGTGTITIAANGAIDVGNLGVGMFACGAATTTVAAGSTTAGFAIVQSVDFATPQLNYTGVVSGTWRNVSGTTADPTSSSGMATFQRIA